MKLSIQLGMLSATNIAIVFLMQAYILTQLGPGAGTDALFAGMTIPQLVLTVISGSLMHVMVPLFSGESEARLRSDAWAFFIIVGGLFALLAVVLYAAAPWWVPLTVPGFDNERQILTIELTRIQLIGMVFSAINGVQWAAWHAKQKFLWVEFSPILASTLGFLLLIWALPRFGIIAAAWIGILRVVIQTILIAPGIGAPVWPDFKSQAVKEGWQRLKPLLLGSVYFKTDSLVDRFVLSMAGGGSLSLYYLSQQIYNSASQVINRTLVAPLVPLLSRLHKTENKHGFKQVYYRKLAQVGTIGLITLVSLVLFGKEVLTLLIGHGNISTKNVEDLWWIMLCLNGMFFGGILGQICSSSFYARGNTTTPIRMSVLTYTINVPAKVTSFYLWGVSGLALATSIYYIINLVLQIYLLERKSVR